LNKISFIWSKVSPFAGMHTTRYQTGCIHPDTRLDWKNKDGKAMFGQKQSNVKQSQGYLQQGGQTKLLGLKLEAEKVGRHYSKQLKN
jgi:hypothetical protein